VTALDNFLLFNDSWFGGFGVASCHRSSPVP
jgi:hypothetical protein